MKAITIFLGMGAAAMTIIFLPQLFNSPSSMDIGAITFFALFSVGTIVLARSIKADQSNK